ncbi:uncharacterized protein LOC134786614 [Penaeus indicus]|uniref:uncharacterized protein LOC134786614 n=1 Tax=Penaeus indicus TaxID=29960 RepID=UPI00300CDBDD
MLTTRFGRLLRPCRRLPICSPNKVKFSSYPVPQSYEVEDGREFKWLWPAYREMEMFKAGHDIGCKQTGGRYRYNTVKPLDPGHVELALRHYQRKIPNCRCFFKERDGKLWVCEDPNPDIDFEYLEGVESSAIINEHVSKPFFGDRTPTWRARLVPVPADAPCPMPEIKAAFPYQYDLVMMPHHSFVDGVSMSILTGKLVGLLNDVIAGRPINDEPFGVYVNNKEINGIDKQIAQNFEKEPEKLELMKQEILACNTTPLLLKAFPPPGGKPATKFVYQTVKQQSLASFTAKCKANGVTFNSGMEAVINTAIIEMAREAGVEGESHQISTHLATDLRRYMKRRSLPILGLHVRPTVHRMETPFDVRDNFWDYTRKLHQRLSLLLKSGEALQQSVVREMTLLQLHAAGTVAHLDYGLTNVGDLTAVIPGVGEHLQQTDLAMIGCTHSFGFPMLHQIYTFRGHSPYTLAYDASYMAKETAVVLTDKILKLMHELGTSP